MKKYRHIFFDLDHTLWDFDTNSRQTLREIYEVFSLIDYGIPNPEHFIQTYLPINEQFWRLYYQRRLSKEEVRVGRFRETLSRFNIDNDRLAHALGQYYVEHSPSKTVLFPKVIETLSELYRHYSLHIITNGFKEVQQKKIFHSGLNGFIQHLIISEEVGAQKPQAEIFNHALQLCKATKSECIMIGDNIQTDVEGALRFGLDAVWFNPDQRWSSTKPTFEIRAIHELLNIL
ncbi:MAG: YjjG family noncanonical pyrimidine nucleotidase [Chitinophagales bacterium]|nr:YjjG family noncanonical pyrimidine nucleotidase [Chitinophagales bacterium]MDW8274185.1 YjjG family noncanonical pyrimidine nucleotidase [Chitinophagales bacterium]